MTAQEARVLRAAVGLYRASADHAGLRAQPHNPRGERLALDACSADLERAKDEFKTAMEDYLRTRG